MATEKDPNRNTEMPMDRKAVERARRERLEPGGGNPADEVRMSREPGADLNRARLAGAPP